MIKEYAKKKEMLRIGISYPNLREASSVSWCSHSPFSPSCGIGWFAIVDVWDRSPPAVNEASHGLGGDEVKMPSPHRTISIVGPNNRSSFASVV
jgi:hypothetical protein